MLDLIFVSMFQLAAGLPQPVPMDIVMPPVPVDVTEAPGSEAPAAAAPQTAPPETTANADDHHVCAIHSNTGSRLNGRRRHCQGEDSQRTSDDQRHLEDATSRSYGQPGGN